MWTCPKCGRTFKNKNQGHYCGEAPKTIDEYIAAQLEMAQEYLNDIRNTIREALPETEEKISWSMPTFWKKQNIIQFASFKKHIGLYPGSEAVNEFSEKLKDYKTNKGTIQFPYDKPLPLDLITEIAKWCADHHSPTKAPKTDKNERIYKMSFSRVYPLLVQKAEKKGRTKEEVDKIICWLTGYSLEKLQTQIDEEVTYEIFFAQAPQMNPNCDKIKGVICGIRVEEIQEPLMQKIRYLDKLIDELARGKSMEKILRA